MGPLAILAAVGATGLGMHLIWKDAREAKRRRETPCDFSEGVSEEDLKNIAQEARRGIKRIVSIDVDGPVVQGVVRSQSGISTWSFSIDFNDWGHITGRYWISSENSDSAIPKAIAGRIEDAISRRRLEV